MTNRYYTPDHEWLFLDGDTAQIGITQYAVDELGDIVYVELPEVGTSITKGDEMGTIESVKTVSSLYAPVSGTVTHVNTELTNKPESINENPYEKGWLIKLTVTDQQQVQTLLNETDYQSHCKTTS